MSSSEDRSCIILVRNEKKCGYQVNIVTKEIQKLANDNHELILIAKSNYTEWKRNR